jgi:hypothetical protein
VRGGRREKGEEGEGREDRVGTNFQEAVNIKEIFYEMDFRL